MIELYTSETPKGNYKDLLQILSGSYEILSPIEEKQKHSHEFNAKILKMGKGKLFCKHMGYKLTTPKVNKYW